MKDIEKKTNGNEEYIKSKLQNSKFKKIMEEGKINFPSAIFCCGLNPKKINKKIEISAETLTKFLTGCIDVLSKNYPYLLDEEKNFKFVKIKQGFNIPVKKDDLHGLLDLLEKESKNFAKKNNIKIFIAESHICPISGNSFAKTQFKNIPPDQNKENLKSIFSEFGKIHDFSHKDGIWTVLYTNLYELLPLIYHVHLENGSKNRWFNVEGALVSFASRTPCSKCKIKGHQNSSCPGDPLIQLLKKENKTSQPKKEKQKIISTVKSEDDSSEDVKKKYPVSLSTKSDNDSSNLLVDEDESLPYSPILSNASKNNSKVSKAPISSSKNKKKIKKIKKK